MKVLLVVKNRRGNPGDIVDVAMGYAKYLIKNLMALYPTKENLEKVRNDMAKIQARIEERERKYQSLAERINSLEIISMKRNANESGYLYGAVSPKDIVDLMKAKDIFIDSSHIRRSEINRIGEHVVHINFGNSTGSFKLMIDKLNEDVADSGE
jgi:large subunit ribosomal protein L9